MAISVFYPFFQFIYVAVKRQKALKTCSFQGFLTFYTEGVLFLTELSVLCRKPIFK